MNNDVAKDLDGSAYAFINTVWPKIKDQIAGGDGELVQIEKRPEDVCKKLDMTTGIDYLLFSSDGCRGIAARVQNIKPYASFTVRVERVNTGAETELSKRIKTLTDPKGYISPSIIVQAYVSKPKYGDLLAAYAVRNYDLYQYANNEYENKAFELKTNGNDGNIFAVFWTDWLKKLGVKVAEYVAENVTPVKPKNII